MLPEPLRGTLSFVSFVECTPDGWSHLPANVQGSTLREELHVHQRLLLLAVQYPLMWTSRQQCCYSAAATQTIVPVVATSHLPWSCSAAGLLYSS